MADLIQTPTYGFNNKSVIPPPSGPNTLSKPGQPYILDLVTRERLFLQNIPDSLKYAPESQFVAIASPGRNNPLYHFTGSEDVLSFTISWYAEEAAKDDVLRKAKWLESLSKNNGYDEKPHIVQFVFGNMFRDAKWLVTSAGPISFGLFDRTAGMLPKLATQDMILKRTTETNRTRAEILSINS